jgi:hypothetical protein
MSFDGRVARTHRTPAPVTTALGLPQDESSYILGQSVREAAGFVKVFCSPFLVLRMAKFVAAAADTALIAPGPTAVSSSSVRLSRPLTLSAGLSPLHVRTLSGSTTNGVIITHWDLKDEQARRRTNNEYATMLQITLPDAGRAQSLKGP